MQGRNHTTRLCRASAHSRRRAAHGLVIIVALFLSPLAAAAQKRTRPVVETTAAETRLSSTRQRDALSQEILLRIVRAEDERRWSTEGLGALVSDRSAAVRRRATLAAGRIGDEGAVAPLASLLQKDADENVRGMAAFALGEIEAAAGAASLLEALRTSKSVAVRARIVEALGKIAAALPVKEEAQRREIGAAILATLDVEGRSAKPERGVILQGLTATLRARPDGAGKSIPFFLASPDDRVRADAANTLARLRLKEAGEGLRVRLVRDADAVVRANAARALGAAEDKAAFDALAARAVVDPDERVRVSAIRALAALKDARAVAPLLQRADLLMGTYLRTKLGVVEHPPEVNELLEISAALGRMPAGSSSDERIMTFLRAFREQLKWSAPEAEIAFARLAPAQYLREQPLDALLSVLSKDAAQLQWQSVAAVAQALGEIAALKNGAGNQSGATNPQTDAPKILHALLDSANTPALAMPDVLRAYAAFKSDDLGDALRAKLNAPDVIVRATAAELLGEMAPHPATTRSLADALPRALKDELNDAALAILDALAKQKHTEAFNTIASAFGSPDYLVRRRAVALLRTRQEPTDTAAPVFDKVQRVATRNRPADYARALARVSKSVRAVVTTDKGQFTIELLPDDAPLTVDNFVELARRKFFDGVAFHRVVPNFVIQGGDPRGDGNGGPGHQIRCEINEVPYDRGAVGMALSGKDTGGSQWFVTHSPQPHLDGGYTVFGRVVAGMDIVDRIARGDRVLGVRIIEVERARE
ncbi:MAG: peptidylprolyl isomerase [Acidobacteriota bacterium]|nr:peptidylprolyl isomerase [Acidobacteriota bacterium]